MNLAFRRIFDLFSTLFIAFCLVPIYWVKSKRLYIFYMVATQFLLTIVVIYIAILNVATSKLHLSQSLSGIIYLVLSLFANLHFTRNMFKYRKCLERLLKSFTTLQHSLRLFFIMVYCWIVCFYRSWYFYAFFTNHGLTFITVMFANVSTQRLEFIMVISCLVAFELKNQFVIFNRTLKKNKNVRSHSKMYKRLTEAVAHYNEIWGLPLIYGIFSSIGLFVYLISLIMFNTRLQHFSEFHQPILQRMTYIFPIGVYITVLASLGEQLCTETKKTIAICYNNALDISDLYVINLYRRKKQKEYLDFAKEVFERNVKLRAAGYFSIDNSLVLFFTVTVCTNLVVVCQMVTNNNTHN
ncbi:hypothetical protein ABEB36_007220 [Hypothenemus hampei]|uniref:Gustatory receptor n=1 Tax=Hypothenemus hampei TaxID=57062 RepID=A0ABD1ET89_HYPHA